MKISKLVDISQLKEIVELEKECFHTPWKEEMLLSSFNSGCVFVIAEEDDKVIGYGGFYPTGDITNVAVSNTFRGHGIGYRIVSEMIEQARVQGVTPLFLEVRRDNNIAIKLYEKCGFKQISVRKRYYENGEDALIYSLEV